MVCLIIFHVRIPKDVAGGASADQGASLIRNPQQFRLHVTYDAPKFWSRERMKKWKKNVNANVEAGPLT